MEFDQFIKKLLPRDQKFYTLLEESTKNLLDAAKALQKVVKEKKVAERKKLISTIKDLEHRGDDITHNIFSELNATYVTPIDREDIHLIASALDDILDHLDGSAGRFTLYKVKTVPASMVKLADILHDSIAEIERGVRLLRNLHDYEGLQKVFQKVNEYENDADRVFEQAIADLFENEKKPIQVIKLKEIFVGLETATDKCEDVANVLEAILIKHA
ncbi:MAG: DUF47 domain-containing protein [Bacteroidota bacterium]